MALHAPGSVVALQAKLQLLGTRAQMSSVRRLSFAACTDEPSDYVNSEKISCQAALHALPGSERRKKCAQPSGDLVHAGLCKRSCSTFSASAAAAGALPYNGWGSVQCCEERVR